VSEKFKSIQHECDVLVVGGGMAGFFAAWKAASMKQRVIVVDKGTVGRSGFTPWANTFSVFDEALGDDANEWIKAVQSKGEYLVNLDYFHMQISDSLERYRQLQEWGIVDEREDWVKGSEISAQKYLKGGDRRLIMPKVLKEAGVKLVERVMLTELIKMDNRVVGAVGFHMEEPVAHEFKCKTLVLCAGAGGYKNAGYPIHGSTFDGDAMAYHAGASISGKDFMDFHFTGDVHPWDVFAMEEEVFVNKIYATPGPIMGGPRIGIDPIFKVAESAPPLNNFIDDANHEQSENDPRGKGRSVLPLLPQGNIIMGSATGLGVHKSEGVWPVDNRCFSGVEGLYAAGDALASMICGASYPTTGMGLSGSAVQGYRAGMAAAEDAEKTEKITEYQENFQHAKERMLAPLKSEKGFSPRWLTQVLQSIMTPYYVLLVMEKSRLESALTQVEYLRDTIANRLKAKDNHELRLVHEAKNLLLNAEMKLRACLMREESRGNHYREDFPLRNDREWLSWVLISKGEKGMVLTKRAVPENWRGDLQQEYGERYPLSFPGDIHMRRV